MTGKIGVLCTYRFPEGMAPTTRILSYGKGLVEHGCKVEVVIFYPLLSSDNYQMSGSIDGIKYTYSHKRNPGRGILYKLFIDRPKSLFNAIRILFASNKKEKFDCVLFSFDHPLFLLFFAPILKLLGFNIGFIGDEFPEPIRQLKESIPISYKLAYKFSHRFISFRILMTEALQNYYNNTVSKKPTYIMCSILDPNRFMGLVKQNVQRRYICYMGNMMLAKDNVDNIIRAFSHICDEYPDIDLYLYGTPNEIDMNVLQKLISDLKLTNRVFIKGRVKFSDVPQTLVNADILVTSQPITKRAEGGFPTKLAEYMMSHTPAIVTDVGEIHKYVKDGELVFMVEPNNEIAYAEKMRFVISNPSLASKVANNAYDFAVNNFGAKEVTNGLLIFLKNIISVKS